MTGSMRHGGAEPSPAIIFPKYNNYLRDKRNFDPNTKIMIPLNLLGIKNFKPGRILCQIIFFVKRKA